MGEEIFTALVAVASGLAFLAYRHPRGFEPVHRVASTVITIAAAFMSGWNFALGRASAAIQTYIPAGHRPAAQAAIDAYITPIWGLVLLGGAMLFFLFLAVLPAITGRDD